MIRTCVFGALSLLALGACATPPEDAQPAPSMAAFAEKIQFWDFADRRGPVYFGRIFPFGSKEVDSCLALAFVKSEGDRVHYIHKLWTPDADAACNYGDVAGRPEGLKKPECFVEPAATEGTRALTVAAMENVRQPGTHSRQLDLKAMKAGFIEPCTHAEVSGIREFLRGMGVLSANVFELTFEDGKMRMHTNPALMIEWLYEIDLAPVDMFAASPVYPAG